MPLNFPTSPTLNQTYSFNNKTWIWDGYGWALSTNGAINNIPVGNTSPSTGAFTTLSATSFTATGNVTANNFIGNGFFTSFIYDDISSATDGKRGTFPLKYNQISQSISDPFALEVSVNGSSQATFIWNSDVLWQTFALGTFKGYTIITTGNITFTNPPLPNSDVTIKTSFGKATTVTKRAPFLPADIVLGT